MSSLLLLELKNKMETFVNALEDKFPFNADFNKALTKTEFISVITEDTHINLRNNFSEQIKEYLKTFSDHNVHEIWPFLKLFVVMTNQIF